MTQQKTISGRDLSKTVTSEDLLGKEVIDFDGSFIGVVEKVLIDPYKLDFVGISIDKGFLRKGFTLGKGYIDKITPHAVFLKIKVSYDVKGKLVFDNDGELIGTVTSIDLYGSKNKIVNIIVKPRMFASKEIVIPASYIETIGDNVMLKINKRELKEEKREIGQKQL